MQLVFALSGIYFSGLNYHISFSFNRKQSMQSKTKNIRVTKNSGEQAKFSMRKLRFSLKKSGASEKDIRDITSKIEAILYNGIPTKEIYKKAFSLLRKKSRPFAAKYKLKKALMELGPSGFPFERYLSEVLKHEGFSTRVGKVLNGNCIQHEVDIVAEKDNQFITIECKFHSKSEQISGVKVPLYVHSRFRDLKTQWLKNQKNNSKTYQGWIATNTRFSTDAIKYGNCVGLFLLSWNHPRKGSLKERIDLSGLHPITCLTTLTKKEKKLLLNKMIVLCKDIRNNKRILLSIGIKENRANRIIEEANAVH